MDLLQLQYFRTVARLEHMTNAARELRIAQPALSKTIARMERDLGVPLFDRLGRQIKLNGYGRAYLAKVETALNALEEGRKEIADMAGMERGRIHLAATTLNRFSELMGSFRALHPQVSFRITQTTAEEMELLLESGEIDFCFTTPAIGKPGIGETPVLHEEMFLAVPPSHRLAERGSVMLSEAAGDSFICLKEGHRFRGVTDLLCRKARITPNIVCEVGENAAIKDLVRAGLGVAIVPACQSDEAMPIVLLRIEEPVCSRTYQLAWLEKRYLSQAARVFREYAVDYFTKPPNPVRNRETRPAPTNAPALGGTQRSATVR